MLSFKKGEPRSTGSPSGHVPVIAWQTTSSQTNFFPSNVFGFRYSVASKRRNNKLIVGSINTQILFKWDPWMNNENLLDQADVGQSVYGNLIDPPIFKSMNGKIFFGN